MASAISVSHPSSQPRVSHEPFAVGIAAIYFVAQLFNILHHPMWRDEMQVWELARQSGSITNLLFLKRYEGHPDGWYVVVYLLQRISNAPIAMQILHLVIATSSAYLLLRFAPFSRLQRILAVFGYFLFFEYATISRGYALGVLCLFAFCAVFRPGSKNYITCLLFLTVLAQTSAYGIILAFAFTIMIWADRHTVLNPDREMAPKIGLIAGTLVVALGSVISGLHILSIGDPSAYAQQTNLRPSITEIGYALTAVSRALLPLPVPTLHFWNTHLLRGPVEACAGITILCASIFLLSRNRPVLVTYCTGLSGVLLLRYLKPNATHFARHDGHIFLLFLSCLWLDCTYQRSISSQGGLGYFRSSLKGPILTTILAAHAFVGIAVSLFADRVPFSQAKAAADYIRSAKLNALLIVADPEFATSTVSGYLDRPLFYSNGERMGTRVLWDTKCCLKQTPSTFNLAANKAIELRQDVLVLVNYEPSTIDSRTQLVASFEGAIVEDENYYLYRIRYQDLVATH